MARDRKDISLCNAKKLLEILIYAQKIFAAKLKLFFFLLRCPSVQNVESVIRDLLLQFQNSNIFWCDVLQKCPGVNNVETSHVSLREFFVLVFFFRSATNITI